MEKELQKLAAHLNLTNPEPEEEEYILTPDEEAAVIEHEITSAKKFVAYRMAKTGIAGEENIDLRFSSIDWTAAVDTKEVLKRANSNKHYDIWQKQQRQKEREAAIKAAEELKQRCTAKYMFNLMAWTSKNTFDKKLIVHDGNKHLITTLCYFLSNDLRFEAELGYSFKRGLLIRGVSGLGKTYLVKCVEKNELNPVLILSMLEITDKIKLEGEYKIAKGNKILYLDDVGAEEPLVNFYGTKITWFENFIQLNYLNNKEHNRLIASTNNDFDEIESKYGFRVRSRIKDMFNIVDVFGQDMRG